jgi:hypothetical protein
MADEQATPVKEKRIGFLQEQNGANSSRRLGMFLFLVPILGVYVYTNIVLKTRSDFMLYEWMLISTFLAAIIGPETIEKVTAMFVALTQIIKPKG